MSKDSKVKSGIHRLLQVARSIFRAENHDYYSENDYRTAERKFLKYALEQCNMEILDKLLKE